MNLLPPAPTATHIPCSSEPVEASLAAYEAAQDAIADITDRDIERVADFIELRLMAATGRTLTRREARAQELFEQYISDEIIDSVELIARQSLTDPAEAGMTIQRISRDLIKKISADHFEFFSEEARSWGWL